MSGLRTAGQGRTQYCPALTNPIGGVYEPLASLSRFTPARFVFCFHIVHYKSFNQLEFILQVKCHKISFNMIVLNHFLDIN